MVREIFAVNGARGGRDELVYAPSEGRGIWGCMKLKDMRRKDSNEERREAHVEGPLKAKEENKIQERSK